MELLAPAGSPEAVTAALQSGADAVYLGFGDFNARRNAKNFTEAELGEAIAACHLHGVRLYLTLNTLLTDRELPKAARVAAQVQDLGVDGVIVQDLGVARMLRQTLPDLELHGSTQMTIHNLDGAKCCADLGFRRVVLARELSKQAIEFLCAHAPLEIEVFVHGALCMCYSGQCYLSSVIGGRSGNRGLCAQPCRLAYQWAGEKKVGHPLSLKDLSLAGQLEALRAMGVACFKIEGRMKRPEYVAIVTRIYAAALREHREPSPLELRQLEQAFSRQGFTQGYYLDKKGPDMFGIRPEKTKDPVELFAQAREQYSRGEHRPVSVSLSAQIREGNPVLVTAIDADGNRVTQQGDLPQEARTKALTAAQVESQLCKTGGTAFQCDSVEVEVEEGLALPVSSLNALRRQVLEELAQQRIRRPERKKVSFSALPKYETPPREPILTVSVQTISQVTPDLLACAPKVLYVPLQEVRKQPETIARWKEAWPETAYSVILPRIVWDREMDQLRRDMDCAREAGISSALVGNWGLWMPAKQAGFALRGDFGLGVFNSWTLDACRDLGFQSATLSFELKLPQIRDINKGIDTELIAYGRLPLMLLEHCILKHRGKGCHCDTSQVLQDRRGMRFPVRPAWGCRNELLNATPLYLADKRQDLQHLGLWGLRLSFTTETPEECVPIAEAYAGKMFPRPEQLTRGLYYRDVE